MSSAGCSAAVNSLKTNPVIDTKSVHSDSILLKLECVVGIKGTTLACSKLSDRSLFMWTKSSSYTRVGCDVLQGSVLGPLFFYIFFHLLSCIYIKSLVPKRNKHQFWKNWVTAKISSIFTLHWKFDHHFLTKCDIRRVLLPCFFSFFPKCWFSRHFYLTNHSTPFQDANCHGGAPSLDAGKHCCLSN